MNYGCHIAKSPKGVLVSLKDAHRDFPYAKAYQMNLTPPLQASLTQASFDKASKEAADVKAYVEEHDLSLIFHSPYMLNAAKDWEEDGEPYWVTTLERELTIAHQMGAVGCVLHLGKSVKLPTQRAEDNMVKTMKHIAQFLHSKKYMSKLIIETSAGQGTELTPTLPALAALYNRLTATEKKHIGLCVDTCHIYAAGIDIGSETAVVTFFDTFERLIGLEYLTVVHLNNSVGALGCKKDRHAALQHGQIPFDGILAFLNQVPPRTPMVLETPSIPLDMRVLYNLFEPEGPALIRRGLELLNL